MSVNANVYQHFRKDEHPFIDSIFGWVDQVENQYSPYLTEFLDPRQTYILENLVRQRSDLHFLFYGGYEQAERKRCLIYPDYYEPTQDDFDIQLFEIIYPKKFTLLSHGQILGTLVNSGLKRESFGDIISDSERWQFFVNRKIEQFLTLQIEKIGNVSIRLEKRKYTEVIFPKDEWVQEMIILSSLRLDNLISGIYNISRQRSKQLIESGKVKVNWIENIRPDFLVYLLDVVSVRGFGRIKIQVIEGKTKKNKLRVLVDVLRK